LRAAGAADPAPGAATEDDGAGGGNGPELTTPLGVSTGIALAVGNAGALAVGRAGALGRGEVVLVPAAPVGALGCEEQLTSADSNNDDATHFSTRFGLPMPQH